jgi:hypothetical protein
MNKDTRVRVTRNSMLMAKPSGVCGNPSDSGSGDNSQRMHQLSAIDWFLRAVDSDGG